VPAQRERVEVGFGVSPDRKHTHPRIRRMRAAE
jgi:hypothetical protein